MKRAFVFALVFFVALSSCRDDDPFFGSVTHHPKPKGPKPNPPDPEDHSLDSLPPDTGGTHTPVVLGADGSPFGYYIYKPSGYTPSGPKFPLLIFLHGWGQIGNSQTDPAELDKVYTDGPPHLIHIGNWSPVYPMVVVSPQCHDSWWDAVKIKAFVEFMITHYRVDPRRIYMTGLSMGGYATYDQLTNYGADSHLAAAVPIAGSGTMSEEHVHNAAEVPLWVFHGESDQTVSPEFSKEVVEAINELDPPVPADLTMFANTGHNCWSETYDGTGMGQEDPAYDPFDMEIYTWMLQFRAPEAE